MSGRAADVMGEEGFWGEEMVGVERARDKVGIYGFGESRMGTEGLVGEREE